MLSFLVHYEIKGFWIAGIVSTSLMGFAYLRIMKETDWQAVADEAKARMQESGTSDKRTTEGGDQAQSRPVDDTKQNAICGSEGQGFEMVAQDTIGEETAGGNESVM